MTTKGMTALLAWARRAGVTVRLGDTDLDPRLGSQENREAWRYLGLPCDELCGSVQGFASPWCRGIELVFPPGLPPSVRLGVLAHELGHQVDEDKWPDFRGTQWKSEVRASERAYELLYGLGISITPIVRSTLNYSILSHGLANGVARRRIERRFL